MTPAVPELAAEWPIAIAPEADEPGPHVIEPASQDDLGFLVDLPRRIREPRSALVVLGSGSRDARPLVEELRTTARALGAILVAPIVEERRFPDYRCLGRRGRGLRADLALRAVLARIGRLGVEPARTFLLGHGGGAELVHRYVMAYPDDVCGAVVAGADAYTLPDAQRAFPDGLRLGGSLPGLQLTPRRFLARPLLVAVGTRDRAQRIERAERYVEAMRGLAERLRLPARVELAALEGAGGGLDECLRAGLDERIATFVGSHRPGRSGAATAEKATRPLTSWPQRRV